MTKHRRVIRTIFGNTYLLLGIALAAGILAASGMAGCGTAAKHVWQSDPATKTASNQFFDAQITPICGDEGCHAFDFFIVNKGDKDLKILWDKTFYISQGDLVVFFGSEMVVPRKKASLSHPI